MNTVAAPVYYPSPNVSRPASQLTEEEQVLRKDALTQKLTPLIYTKCKSLREQFTLRRPNTVRLTV